MKRAKTLLFMILVGSLVTLAACGAGNSGDTDPEGEAGAVEFPTKEITLVLNVSAGGGFDTVARMLVPYWEKHLPGSTFVVVNKPGGDGVIGINEMRNAEPDGHTLAMLNIPGNAVSQVTGAADFDITEFEWIGRVSNVVYAAGVNNDFPLKSIEDFENAEQPLKLGGVGINATATVGAMIAGKAIGFDVEVIPHPGSKEGVLSTIRGDTDFVQYPLETMVPLIQAGEITPLWVYNEERIDDIPDVPTIGEVGYPELVDPVALHRPIATTPGTPDEIVEILRDSFWDAVNDPEFVEAVNEYEGSKTIPLNGEDTENLIQNSIEFIEEYKELFEAK